MNNATFFLITDFLLRFWSKESIYNLNFIFKNYAATNLKFKSR